MQTKARTSTTILMTVIKYGLQVFDWAAFVSGGAYLVWLLLSRNLLEPIPVGGTLIELDLLQTLAFFVAVTALEGTIIVTAVSKMYEVVTESELSEIRRNRSQALLGDDQPSRIQQVFGFMRWIRDAILVVLAILVVRQGWAAASLNHIGEGATSFSVGGWLGAAWSISWVVLVFAVTYVSVHVYCESRHLTKIQPEAIDVLDDDIKRLQQELELKKAEAERLVAERERLEGRGP